MHYSLYSWFNELKWYSIVMQMIITNPACRGTKFLGIAPCNITCLELKLTRYICARGIFPLNTVFETHLFIFVFDELENWSRASRYHQHYISSFPTINGTTCSDIFRWENTFEQRRLLQLRICRLYNNWGYTA